MTPSRRPFDRQTSNGASAARQAVLATLHADRFVDLASTEIYAQLLDDGHHLYSIRTMYGVLA